MNAFCVWLHQEGHLAAPVKLQKLRVEKRVLTLLDDTQMRALIRFRPRTFRQARVHLAACLILDTGLRISEALHLRRDDVDYDNLILKVFGKGQKERLVPFSHDLRKRLYRFGKWQAEKGIQSHLISRASVGRRGRSGTARRRCTCFSERSACRSVAGIDCATRSRRTTYDTAATSCDCRWYRALADHDNAAISSFADRRSSCGAPARVDSQPLRVAPERNGWRPCVL